MPSGIIKLYQQSASLYSYTMIAIGHSSIGAIIGVSAIVTFAPTTPLALRVLVVFLAGIVSHYLADAIPHGHYKFEANNPDLKQKLLLALDLGVGCLWLSTLAFSAVGWGAPLLLISAGISGALLPDAWEAAVTAKRIPNSKFARAHRKFHFDLIHWHNDHKSKLPNGARPFTAPDVYLVILVITASLLILTLPRT